LTNRFNPSSFSSGGKDELNISIEHDADKIEAGEVSPMLASSSVDGLPIRDSKTDEEGAPSGVK
jgi:hypothetical protein